MKIPIKEATEYIPKQIEGLLSAMIGNPKVIKFTHNMLIKIAKEIPFYGRISTM